MKLSTLKSIFAAVVICVASGCSSPGKSRSFESQGMFVSDSGQLAIGKIHVDSIPDGLDSAIIHYYEDTAWLSPSTKIHKIDVFLTGTNSTTKADTITDHICKAFVAVMPGVPPKAEVSDSDADLDATQGETKPTEEK